MSFVQVQTANIVRAIVRGVDERGRYAVELQYPHQFLVVDLLAENQREISQPECACYADGKDITPRALPSIQLKRGDRVLLLFAVCQQKVICWQPVLTTEEFAI